MVTTALILDDDPRLAFQVQEVLRAINCQAKIVYDTHVGLQEAATGRYDLLVLNWELPNQSGLAIYQHLWAQQVSTPILALTTQAYETVQALDLGVDDCMARPYNLQELRARAQARLRVAGLGRQLPPAPVPTTRYTHADLVLDLSNHRVLQRGQPVPLTPKEFDLLALFMRHPGRVYSRVQLLDQLWGLSYEGYEHTISSHINRLRLKIEPNATQPTYILTVWGRGYQFANELPA